MPTSCLVPGRIAEAAPARAPPSVRSRRSASDSAGAGSWLGSTAKTWADSAANSCAVIAAIAPICVDQFQRSADAGQQPDGAEKDQRMGTGDLCRKRRLGAVMPGSKAIDSGVPQACAAILQQLEIG